MSPESKSSTETLYSDPRFIFARDWAKSAHAKEFRDSGEPYFCHLERVVNILIGWGIRDIDTLCAAWLHDSVEDVGVNPKEIVDKFNPKVGRLVETVTKFRGSLDAFKDLFKTHQKIAVGATIDIGSVEIKLADRLDNMASLDVFSAEKRKRISRETVDVYCVMADALGMWKVRRQLQDLAFRHLDPQAYAKTHRLLQNDPRISEAFINRQKIYISGVLYNTSIEYYISERVKGVYATLLKHAKNCLSGDAEPTNLSQIQDIISLGIICKSEDACYTAVRELAENLGDRHISRYYLDEIARPADNGYRAIKTAFLSSDNPPQLIELAFMTPEMLDRNLNGVINQPDIKTMQLIPVFDTKGKLDIVPQGFTALGYLLRTQKDLIFHRPTCTINGQPAEFNSALNAGDIILFTPHSQKIKPISESLLDAVEPREQTQILELIRDQEIRKSRLAGQKKVAKLLSRFGIFDLADLGLEKLAQILTGLDIDGISLKNLDQLYEMVGGKFISPQKVRQVLTELITLPDNLRYATLIVTGKRDQPGILADLAKIVSDCHCNIVSDSQVVATGYYIRMLFTCTKDQLAELQSKLSQTGSTHSSIKFI